MAAGNDSLPREPDLCALHEVFVAGNCYFDVRARRDVTIIENSNVARRYSGDVAGTRSYGQKLVTG